MKFIAISTAFALSSQVLAAPVLLDNVLPEVSGLTGTVENVVASAEGTVGGLVDPIVGPLVNPVLGTVAGRDVGSTVAGAESQVFSTLTVVQTLKGNVETELSTIRMYLSNFQNFN
jgi:hypothetical protein